jgi:hypothetical protein
MKCELTNYGKEKVANLIVMTSFIVILWIIGYAGRFLNSHSKEVFFSEFMDNIFSGGVIVAAAFLVGLLGFFIYYQGKYMINQMFVCKR